MGANAARLKKPYLPAVGALDGKVDAAQLLPSNIEAEYDKETFELVKTEAGKSTTRVNEDTGFTEILVRNKTKPAEIKWVPVEKNTINEITDKVSKLDEAWSTDDPNIETLIYWLDKFRTSHDKVKEEFYKLHKQGGIAPSDKTTTIFDDYSDSIGNFVEQHLITWSCIPFGDADIPDINQALGPDHPDRYEHLDRFDPEQSKLDNEHVPQAYNQLLDEKLWPDTKKSIFEFSKRTESQFRRNIRNVLGDLVVGNGENTWKSHVLAMINEEAAKDDDNNTYDVKRKAHGENLVGDYMHMLRMHEGTVSQLQSIVSDNLGRLWDVFLFIKLASEYDPTDKSPLNKQNVQKAIKPDRYVGTGIGYYGNKVDVEGTMVKIDLLQNKIQDVMKLTTNVQVLSTDPPEEKVKDAPKSAT